MKRKQGKTTDSLWRLTIIFFSLFFLQVSINAYGQGNSSPEFMPGVLLVKFEPGTAAHKKTEALDSIKGVSETEFKIVPGLQKILTNLDVEKAVSILSKNPNIEYAEPDYILTADVVPNDTRFSELWGMNDAGDSNPDNDINGPEAWNVFTGDANQVIAIIDTGIDYNHPDLNDNMWRNVQEFNGTAGVDNDGNGFIDDIYGYDFCNNDGNPFDGNSHGTHVSGTICAEGNNSQGVAGVNWRCKLMAVKFLCDNGSGSTSNAIKSVQYAVLMGVKISNNSWGGGGYSQALKDAIQNAGANVGHIFVSAAGNDNVNADSSPHYPSSYDLGNIISVASITDDGARSSFSNYGSNSVDLGAPGSSILSTVPGGGYSLKSGTSMATPHVTGVVALVYALNPTYTYAQVIQKIFNNVKPLSSMSGITVTGGIVNAFASINVSPPLLKPVAPSDLLANAVDERSIDLSWIDHSDNEAVFVIERQKGVAGYSETGSVASNVNSYTDNGLEASTLYCYRVKARNAAGDSGYTNEYCDTTAAPPPFVDVVAGTQNLKNGTITSGSLSSTYINDGVYLALQEKLSTGIISSLRKSFLETVWTFQIPSGCLQLTLYANAFYSLNALDRVNNNEVFNFEYWNGASWIKLFNVTPSDSFDDIVNPYYTNSSLPVNPGSLSVRVVDSDPNTAGNNGKDRISIDHMFIRCE